MWVLDGDIVLRHLIRDAPQMLLDRRDRSATDLASRRQILLTISRYNALKHGILAKAVIPKALEPYES